MVDVDEDISMLIMYFDEEYICLFVVVCGIGMDVCVVVEVIYVGVKEYIFLLFDVDFIVVVLEVVLDDVKQFIFVDVVMKCVIDLVDQIVLSDVSVFIMGEFGIGKEVMVYYVYCKLKCVEKLFIFVNCVVILENFLELELFGYEKGLFIGVVLWWIGKFEEVNGGIFFFDEISEMDICLQVKLFCVI